MDIGVIFPQTEVGDDPGAVRAIGQAAADLGYTHLAAYDHVLGADIAVHGDIGGPYTIDDPFREPLTMFAYLAGFTDLAFATSILIGPQRQTALLAKQAAEVDLLSGGRFRLGLGVGWNKVEYDALGMPFDDAGRSSRSRSRSCAPCGRSGASRSTGASTTSRRPASRRCRCSGRSRSGSAPSNRPRCAEWAGSPTAGSPWPAPGAAWRRRSRTSTRGRPRWDATSRTSSSRGGSSTPIRDLDKIAEHARRWREAGATHLSVNTMHSGLSDADAHIAALEEMAPVLL